MWHVPVTFMTSDDTNTTVDELIVNWLNEAQGT